MAKQTKNFQKRTIHKHRGKIQGVLLAGNSLGSTLKWIALWEYDGLPFHVSKVPKLDGLYIFFQNSTCSNVQTKTSSKLTEYSFRRKARSKERHDTYNACCSSDQEHTEISGTVEQKAKLQNTRALNMCFQMLLPQFHRRHNLYVITGNENHEYNSFFHPLRDCGPW